MALEGYEVHRIAYKDAMAMVVEHHYLHRKAPASFCFGLFDESSQLLGTVVYGKPASPSLCKGIAGADESSRVIELTRLWIADITPKNAESFLIGNSLKMLPTQYDIVVSFAEIGAGHLGTVYQATNWIYTGKSDRHVEWKLDGQGNKHSRHLFDEHGGINGAKEFYGDRLKRLERPRKHRYVMFRGSKYRKRELLGKLRYPVMDYPKHEMAGTQ
jgi:hypothetical protein